MGSRRSEVLMSSLITGITYGMARLVDIWDSIGFMEDKRVERMQTVKKYIEHLFKEMITEEESLRHRIKTNIVMAQKELETLSLELAVEPYKVDEDLTHLELENKLRRHVKALRKEKHERLRELSELRQQDEELCVTLCAIPYSIPAGHTPTHTQLQELRDHVKQLSEEKMTKLVKAIDKVRQELVVLWDKCMFAPEQREAFSAHFCNADYTEELLSLHECELLKVKGFYEKARPLLENIKKWEKNWELFQDLERKAADPNRLYNRGGVLLRESKDRAKLLKLLSKLEEELRSRVQAWEKDESVPFLMRGQRVLEFISSQWEAHRMHNDKARTDRMRRQKLDSTPMKTPKRPHRASTSCMTPNKRWKTPNPPSVRSGAFSTTLLCVPRKLTLSAQKSRPFQAGPVTRSPLREFNRSLISPTLTLESELSKKANHESVQ